MENNTVVANPTERADRRKWLTLLVLALGLAIVIIDGTIVNVAIPSIRKEFNTNLRNLEWVNSIYSLIYAALIVTWGRVGDQIGRKRIFIVGVSVFVAGSMLAGIAPSIGFLIAARAVQGLGAAMTSPSTLSIVSSTFTGKMRGVAFGVWGAVAGASAALGPLLGGWLTTNASWRWAFYVNLPIGLIAIIGSIIFIQESREANRKVTFDIPGILLVSLGVGAVVFGLIEGQAYGWWQPAQAFTLGSWSWPLTNLAITPFSFLIGAIALVGFVLWENRVRTHGGEPLFDFSLLRFNGFRFGLLTVSIVALGEFGVIFVLSLYLQGVRGLSAFDVGLTFLPFAILTLFVAPLAGILSSRVGAKWVVTAGMLFEALAIFLLSLAFGVDTPRLTIILILMVYGMGVGLAIAQLTNVVLSEIPYDRIGAASGANNTIRQIGAAMGIAIIGAILTTQISTSATTQFKASKDIPVALQTVIIKGIADSGGSESGSSASGKPAGAQNSPLGKEILGIVQQSFVDGSRAASRTASVFVLLGAISSLLIPNNIQRKPKVVMVSE